MDEAEQLLNIARNHIKQPDRTAKLGQALSDLMQRQISPQQARFEPLSQTWEYLLPEQLRRHCRIVDISGGQLKVSVDSPAYLYELKLCSSELIEQLRQQCPKAKIKNIKFAVG